MIIYITQYEREGKVYNGPYKIAESIEEANLTAKHCNVELIGELVDFFGFGNFFETEDRVVH